MPELLPTEGLEVHGLLHTVPASELQVGDVVIAGYIRRVYDEPTRFMGYVVFTAAKPVIEDGFTTWTPVGKHQHLPDHQVLVLRLAKVCEAAQLQMMCGTLWRG